MVLSLSQMRMPQHVSCNRRCLLPGVSAPPKATNWEVLLRGSNDAITNGLAQKRQCWCRVCKEKTRLNPKHKGPLQEIDGKIIDTQARWSKGFVPKYIERVLDKCYT